jgi:hypothetical protein
MLEVLQHQEQLGLVTGGGVRITAAAAVVVLRTM